MRLERTIPWAPFSEKHKRYIKQALNNSLNVAEGAVRSGKTIDHCIIAAMYLETCTDMIHLASGSSQPNAKLNIGVCNGFGLESLFRGRCKWGKYRGNEALFIDTQTGEKVVIFVGGGKSDSYKKILGNSYGMWIATEINEHYDSDDSRTSFIKVAMNRQLAADKPLTLWDLNPCKPTHPIYTNYIDKWRDNYDGGYQYQHFTINDNLSITEERRKQIEQRYDRGSIWYQRDIEGKRVQAEGLVFPKFAENPDKWKIKYTTKAERNKRVVMLDGKPLETRWCEVGFDIGGNGSAYALTCSAELKSGEIVVMKAEKRQAQDMAMEQVNEFVDTFVKAVQAKYGVQVGYINCDHVDVIINTLNDHTPYRVGQTYKPPLEDRVFTYSCLLAAGMIKFVDGECDDLIDELCDLVYDTKQTRAIPLDDGTMQIDTYDSLTYSIADNWAYISEKFGA